MIVLYSFAIGHYVCWIMTLFTWFDLFCIEQCSGEGLKS